MQFRSRQQRPLRGNDVFGWDGDLTYGTDYGDDRSFWEARQRMYRDDDELPRRRERLQRQSGRESEPQFGRPPGPYLSRYDQNWEDQGYTGGRDAPSYAGRDTWSRRQPYGRQRVQEQDRQYLSWRDGPRDRGYDD